MKNFKKVLALVLAVATLLSFATIASAATSADYKDAAAIEKNGQTEAVDVLSYIGVLAGYPDKNFKADNEITRAEAAKIIAMFDNGSTDISSLYTSANPFTDVKGNWAESYVAYGYKAGIIAGVGKLLFAPNAKLTGVQFLKMVLVVLGYDAKAEGLEGASWAVNTLALARKIGLLDNLPATFDVAANLTRGNAATIMLNALNTHTVVYGQKFIGSALANGTILTAAGAYETADYLYTEWGLSKATSYDVWGAPNHSWALSGKTFVTYENTPVLTYTKQVKFCDILVDLGVAKTSGTTKTVDYVAANGALKYGTMPDELLKANLDVDLTLQHNSSDYCLKYTNGTVVGDKTIGGQGALTRVYKLDSGYAIVTIDTYLAQVNAVNAVTHYAAANMTMTVWETPYANSNGVIRTNVTDFSGTYAVGDYALVYKQDGNYFDGAVNEVYVNSKATPAATGVLTAYASQTSTTVGGKEYPDAAKFDKGYQGVYNTTYDVYTDSYGNVIGLVLPSTAYTYAVIDVAAWQNSIALADPYLAANIVDMTAAKTPNVAISKDAYLDGNFDGAADIQNAEANGQTAVALDVTFKAGGTNANNIAYASTDNDRNVTGGWTTVLYKFTKNAAGQYAIVDAGITPAHVNGAVYGTAANCVFVKGVQTKLDNYYTNDTTKYLVKTLVNGVATYTAYTGYQNMPSYTGAKISYYPAANGVYVDMVFVDATAATLGADSTQIAFINSKTAGYLNAGLNGYDVYLDGTATAKYATTAGDTAMSNLTIARPYLYRLSYNTDKNIVGVAALTNDIDYKTLANLTGCNQTVITNATNSAAASDTDSVTLSADCKYYQIGSNGSLTTLTNGAADVQALITAKAYANGSSVVMGPKYDVTAYVVYTSASNKTGIAVYVYIANEYKYLTVANDTPVAATTTLVDKDGSSYSVTSSQLGLAVGDTLKANSVLKLSLNGANAVTDITKVNFTATRTVLTTAASVANSDTTKVDIKTADGTYVVLLANLTDTTGTTVTATSVNSGATVVLTYAVNTVPGLTNATAASFTNPVGE